MYINKIVQGVKIALNREPDNLINTLKTGTDYWADFSLDNANFSICVSKDANIYEITVYDSDGENIDPENSCVVYNAPWLSDFLMI
jgi:hypothetical protein